MQYQPPPPPPPPDLPHPWTEHKDPTGKSYYYNPSTKQTQWTPPTATSAPPPPPPPAPPESYPSYPPYQDPRPDYAFPHDNPPSHLQTHFPQQNPPPSNFQPYPPETSRPPGAYPSPPGPQPPYMPANPSARPPLNQQQPYPSSNPSYANAGAVPGPGPASGPSASVAPPQYPPSQPYAQPYHPDPHAFQDNSLYAPNGAQSAPMNPPPQHMSSQNFPPARPPFAPDRPNPAQGQPPHPPPELHPAPHLYPQDENQTSSHPVAQLYPSDSSPPSLHNVGPSHPLPSYNLPGGAAGMPPPPPAPHVPQRPSFQKPPPGYPANAAAAGRPPVAFPHTGSQGVSQKPSYLQSNHSFNVPQVQASHGPSASALVGGIAQLSMGPEGQSSGTYISLEFRAAGLKNKDFIGRSDPICYVYVPDEPTNFQTASDPSQIAKWKVIGSTEIVENSISPNWATRVKVPYYFERHQPMRFALVDVDSKKNPMKGDKLGHCMTTLAQIVRNGSLTEALVSGGKKKSAGKNMGSLSIRAHDEDAAGKVRIQLCLGAKNLDKMDTFSKSDPFYELRHVLGSGASGTSMVHKSEHIDNDLNPNWVPHTAYIPVGNTPWSDVKLTVSVYDWNKYKAPALIGDVTFSLECLTSTKSFNIINRKKQSRRSYKNSGQLIIHRADAAQLPSFVSYIQGGLRLNFIVAVDFTASNRRPTSPDSLHFNGDPSRPSQYAQALSAVGNTLLGYIPDGQMTALGFGAILPGQGGDTSFDFALTGATDPRVYGVDHLLGAYYQAVDNVTFSSPTNFTPLLRNAMNICSATPVSQDTQHFSVLMILTDGMVTDLTSTIDTIIEASYNTPIAIVIVGIGNANFSTMERLDGDNTTLRSEKTGKEAKHDIVQFTKFTQGTPIDTFAKEVLQEVPKRVVEYMVDEKIRPNQPVY